MAVHNGQCILGTLKRLQRDCSFIFLYNFFESFLLPSESTRTSSLTVAQATPCTSISSSV